MEYLHLKGFNHYNGMTYAEVDLKNLCKSTHRINNTVIWR